MMGMVRGLSVALARPSAGPASSVVRRLAPNGWHRTETATNVFAGNATDDPGESRPSTAPYPDPPPGTSGRAQPAQPPQVNSGCQTLEIDRRLFARNATKRLTEKHRFRNANPSPRSGTDPPAGTGRAQSAHQPPQVISGCQTPGIRDRVLSAGNATRPLEKEDYNNNKIIIIIIRRSHLLGIPNAMKCTGPSKRYPTPAPPTAGSSSVLCLHGVCQ